MASNSEFRKSQQKTSEELEELIIAVEKLLDRTKVMYEQYFMGVQKLPPSQLHRDLERRILELTQEHIRNTGIRFRFTTLKQKFGSYNTYWRRVLRQIDQGTYIRDIQRVTRKALREGEDIPEELLVKLPRRMQDKIRRDRAAVGAQMDRQGRTGPEGSAEPPAAGGPPTPAAVPGMQRRGVFTLEEDDLGEGLDDLFAAMTTPPPPEAGAPTTGSMGPPPPSSPARPGRTGPAALGQPAPGQRPPPTGARPPGTPPPLSTTGARPPVPPLSTTGARPPVAPLSTTGARAPVAPLSTTGARPPVAPLSTTGARPSVAPSPARPPGPASGAAPPPGMNEQQCRDLHARYVKARELVGKASDMSYDKLMASLNKQAPGIMKEHGARGVEFNVVIKGDKVVLKAKPQK